jgi:RNA polymerase sigma-70 factor, ECF subfamily
MLDTAERTSLRELARAQLPGLYALARQLAGADADDLVQRTLLRACRSFSSLNDLAAGPKWLRVIMVNIWRDDLRKDGREPDEVPLEPQTTFSLYRTLVDEDPFPYSDTMHVDFLGAFSPEDVHEVLRRLPEHFRVPLVLRYLEGFGAGEVADLLGVPAGTVYSYLHRGRQHFERALWDYARESGLVDTSVDGREDTGEGRQP